jgi:hypothetical protein
MFNLSLVIGIIDLFISSQYGFTITSRHLYELYQGEPRNLGFRFHGIFGEPRDAFVILGLGGGFYCLRSSILNRSQSKYYYLFLFVCALLTDSTSGFIGLAIFIVIYLIQQTLKFNRYLIKKLLFLGLLGIISYAAIINSVHTLQNIKYVLEVKQIYIESGDLWAPNTIQNIYPIFWMLDNIKQHNLIPVLFGTGLGSVSFINNVYSGGIGDLMNPNANIIRLFCNTGVIGFLVYIFAFYFPVSRNTAVFTRKTRNNIIFFSLLILSLTLSHRSSANFIFLGVFLATVKVYYLNPEKRPLYNPKIPQAVFQNVHTNFMRS